MRLKPIGSQVVVVFGASSGIGREAARRFAARGAKVVVSARSEEGLRSLVDEIRREGGEAIAVPADATDYDQVKALAARAVEAYGRIDTWAHTAAVALFATFDQTTVDEFRQVVEINLMGYVHGIKASLPYLRENGGALILVSSVEAMRALPCQAAYASTKHAVHGLVESLRVELAHEGSPVVLTEILPPTTNTPLFNKARTKIGVKPMGIPPIYPAEAVAEAIVKAAAHPARQIIVGSAGQVMVNSQRLSPRLIDSLLTWFGFDLQRTNEPKSPAAPDNLFGPISGYDRVDGDFKKQAALLRPTSLFQREGVMTGVVGAVTLGALALMANRAMRSR